MSTAIKLHLDTSTLEGARYVLTEKNKHNRPLTSGPTTSGTEIICLRRNESGYYLPCVGYIVSSGETRVTIDLYCDRSERVTVSWKAILWPSKSTEPATEHSPLPDLTTPRPWKVANNWIMRRRQPTADIRIGVCDAYTSPKGVSDPRDRANADLIVRAVNERAELLAALRAAFDYYMGPHACGDFTCACNDIKHCGICSMRDVTRAVLERAERGE